MAVLFLAMIFLVLHSVIRRGTKNKPAAVAILMGLALPCIVMSLDTFGRFLGPLLPLVAAIYVPGLIFYTVISVIFGLWGLVWRNRDNPQTGFLWSVTGMALAILISFVAAVNFTSATQVAHAAHRDAAMKEEMAETREERLKKRLEAEMEQFNAWDGSFSVIMPNQIKFRSCTDSTTKDGVSFEDIGEYDIYVGEMLRSGLQFTLIRYIPLRKGEAPIPDSQTALCQLSSELDDPLTTITEPTVTTSGGIRQWHQTAATQSGYKVDVRSYFAKGQFYMLAVLSQTGEFGKDANTFFNSFQVKKKVTKFTREEFNTPHGRSWSEATEQHRGVSR